MLKFEIFVYVYIFFLKLSHYTYIEIYISKCPTFFDFQEIAPLPYDHIKNDIFSVIGGRISEMRPSIITLQFDLNLLRMLK